MELEDLRFQFGTSRKWGGRMLSGVLHSERAIQVNVAIMRTSVQFRRVLESNNELAKKFEQIECELLRHDHDLKSVFEAIQQLMDIGSPLIQKKIKPLGEK